MYFCPNRAFKTQKTRAHNSGIDVEPSEKEKRYAFILIHFF